MPHSPTCAEISIIRRTFFSTPPVTSVRGDATNWIRSNSAGPTASRNLAPRRRFGSAVKMPSTSATNTARSGRNERASSSISRSPEQMENPRRTSRTTSPNVTGVKAIDENSRNGVRSIDDTRPSSRLRTAEGGIGTAAKPASIIASTTSASSAFTSAWTRAAADRFASVAPPSCSLCLRARMCPYEPAPWTTSSGFRTAASSRASRRIAARRGVRRRALSVRTLPPSFTRSMARAPHPPPPLTFSCRHRWTPPVDGPRRSPWGPRVAKHYIRPGSSKPARHDPQARKHVSRDSRPSLHPEGIHGRRARHPNQSVRHRRSPRDVSGEDPPRGKGGVSDPAHRPRIRADLREPVHREEGGECLPPEAPALPAQRVTGEQDCDGRRSRPHLRGHARGVWRSGRHGGPSQAGHEDLHDLDDGGPRRRRERGAPERRREAADAVVPRDPERKEEALIPGTGFSRAAGLPPRSWATQIVSWT